MEDTPPKDQKEIESRDPLYKKKLEYSYLQCLKELCEPVSNWQDIILETKFTVDSSTHYPKTNYTFVIDHPDDIIVPEVNHSYVFKRSHFYNSFNNKKSRIKRDLIECWKGRGYFVRLSHEGDKWNLFLSWKN